MFWLTKSTYGPEDTSAEAAIWRMSISLDTPHSNRHFYQITRKLLSTDFLMEHFAMENSP